MKPILKIGAAALLLTACNTTPNSDINHNSKTKDQTSQHVNEAGDISTTLFENDFLQVKRVDVPVGHFVPMHSGHARVIYSLGDYTLEWTEEGQPTAIKHWSAGETHSHGDIAHQLTNIGDTAASYLIIERSKKPLPAQASGLVSAHKDVSQAEHEHNTPVFEDDKVRLVRVRLNPGESLPPHTGVLRAIYSLGDYQLAWTEADGSPKLRQWQSGDTHWHNLGQHSAKNTGDTVAEWLIIEPK